MGLMIPARSFSIISQDMAFSFIRPGGANRIRRWPGGWRAAGPVPAKRT